ncbi:MAG: thiamine-phosphate kinase [Bacteroidales bacterium]|nr:thiamine-phosphate kinase [Bacteroidales bacterium]
MRPDSLAELGEFGLIDRIRSRFPAPSGITGIGDDCAVIPQRCGCDTLVSTDMLVEGTHFLREDITPYDLGWKSAAVNLSDIAAMGGRPTATFLSLALPASLDPGWIEAFMNGYADISGRFDTALLGGDTTASPDRICINVAVLGECPSGKARLRSSAMSNDLICVTGPLGDSAAGLKAILQGVERDADVQRLIERHYRPVPRVAEGLRLAATPGVHAMMDISDGIGSDLEHILEASSRSGRAATAEAEKKPSLRSEMPLQRHPAGTGEPLGAEVRVEAIPLSPALKRVCARLGWDAAELAVCGGEDYELLFTVDPEAEKTLDVPHTVIGAVTERRFASLRSPSLASLGSGIGPGMTDIEWRGAEGPVAGFDHFKNGTKKP